MNNKLLYIGDNPTKSTNGGEWINKRNILALENIFHNNLHIYPIACKKPFNYIHQTFYLTTLSSEVLHL